MKNIRHQFSSGDFIPGTNKLDIRLSPSAGYELRMTAYEPEYGLDLHVTITAAESGKTVLDYDAGWFAYLPRTEFAARFSTPDETDYRLTLEIRKDDGSTAAPVHSLALIPAGDIPPDEACVYSHSIMHPFDPETPAGEKWRIEKLRLAGGVNQTAAALFAMQTAKSFEALNAFIEPPPEFPAECFELRNISAQVLPPAAPRPAAAGQRLGWWLTFSPPEGAAPGRYSGRIEFRDGAAPAAAIPLEVEIEDYRLPESDIAFLQYHSERYIPGKYLNDRFRRACYEDMKRHGMNSVTVYNNPDVDGKTMDFNHNWQFSPEELKLRKSRGCPGTDRESPGDWKKRFDFGLARELDLITAAGLGGGRFPVLWLAGKIGYSSDRNDWWGSINPGLVKKISRAWRSRSDWPVPLYYVIDEPTGYGDRTEKALELLRKLGRSGCRRELKTTTANLDAGTLGRYYDVWIQSAARISEKMQAAARKNGAELWAYCCSVNNRNTALPRAMFGFWAARAGIAGVAQWAYYDARDGFCGDDPQSLADRSRTALSRVGLTPAGPVPTAAWEATREGVTDYRLTLLFRQSMEKLKRFPGSPRAEKILKNGTLTWEKIIGSIPDNLFAPLNDSGSFADRNSFRPLLGFGDPATIFERKRQALLTHIRETNQFLKEMEDTK